MSYPGNTSLSQEIRQRILSTFQQTLSMATEGKRQEAMLGCDFILRLDPQFELARTLQGRIQGSDGPVETNDLEEALETGAIPADLADTEVQTADDLFEESAAAGAETLSAPEAPTPEPAAERAVADPAAGDTAAGDRAVGEGTPAPQVESEATTLEASTDPDDEFWNEEDDASISLEGEEDEAQSQDRIADLLEEGQGSFETGEYQAAIDSWSRIFLLDIDHAEATRRIELARKLKAEVERKVEEVFHEGLSFIESGSFEQARDSFERVLEMNPHHMAAREYLQKLDENPAELTSPKGPAPDIRSRMPEPVTGDDLDDDNLLPPLSAIDLSGEISTPPPGEQGFEDPSPEAAVFQAARPPKRPTTKKKTFQLMAAAGVLLVLVSAWFLYSRRQQMFPNSADQEIPTQQTRTIDPIARATALFDEGRTALAIAQLRRLPPDHPKQAEAEALIAQWESGEAAEGLDGDGLDEDAMARRQEMIDGARAASEAGDNLSTAALLEQAGNVAELEESELELQQVVSENLASLKSELELFRQGDWEFALPGLWRIYVDDPLNRDARRLLIDSYVNIGIRELQRGDPATAQESFQEALNLDPDDLELRRLAAFAATYQGRDSDLLYRIFVKYQPFR